MRIYSLYRARLYQSGLIDNWPEMLVRGIRTIINLGELDDMGDYRHWRYLNNAGTYIWHPIDDGPLPKDLDSLEDLAQFSAQQIRAGKAVLIHCDAGQNRSMLLAGWILSLLDVATGDDLVRYLRARHPGTLFNRSFADFVAGLPDGYRLRQHLQAASAE